MTALGQQCSSHDAGYDFLATKGGCSDRNPLRSGAPSPTWSILTLFQRHEALLARNSDQARSQTQWTRAKSDTAALWDVEPRWYLGPYSAIDHRGADGGESRGKILGDARVGYGPVGVTWPTGTALQHSRSGALGLGMPDHVCSVGGGEQRVPGCPDRALPALARIR